MGITRESEVSNFYKNVCNTIAFCNPYLVKSVNLSFTHVLFWSVYHDVVASNVTVNRPELLAPFLTPEETNLVQVISFRTGLILSG